MKIRMLIALSIGGLLVGAGNTHAQEQELDNERPRPIVLPKNRGEVQLGVGSLYQKNYDDTLIGIFSLAYGVKDNLELSLFGARYRFMRTPDQEMTLYAKMLGFGYSSNDRGTRWSADTELRLAGKWKMDRL